MSNLSTPENIQKLQAALHAKAKGEPGYRFYSLYDKICRRDILGYAYVCCRANQGAAGVDAERFEDIEANGVERWLGELTDTLRKKTYQAQALRRVYVPKPNGTLRALVDSHDPGQNGDDGGDVDSGADLRNRPANGTARIPTGT